MRYPENFTPTNNRIQLASTWEAASAAVDAAESAYIAQHGHSPQGRGVPEFTRLVETERAAFRAYKEA